MKISRICIIGGSGTGKTTLSNNLEKILNLPLYHIDSIHHIPNWGVRDKTEREQIILDIIKKKKWIIDGTYTSTLRERLKRADLVIFLDYSLFSRLKGIFGRYFKNHGKEKEEIPGCRERISFVLIKSAFKFRGKLRKKIISILEECHHPNLLVFKSQKDLNTWYKEKFNESIIF